MNLILFGLIVAFFVGLTEACSCFQSTWAKMLCGADFVILGTVSESICKNDAGAKRKSCKFLEYNMEDVIILKKTGASGLTVGQRNITLGTPGASSVCGVKLQPNTRYLASGKFGVASGTESPKLIIDLCNSIVRGDPTSLLLQRAEETVSDCEAKLKI